MQEPKTQRKQADAPDDNAGSEDKKMGAEDFKERGNQALKTFNFNEAIVNYGKAIELDPKNHVYYSNRSAAYLRLNKYKEALIDANKCIEVHDAWARGFGRKGAALFGLKKYSKAIDAYQAALRFEPNSSLYKSEIESCKQAQQGKPVSSSGSAIKKTIFSTISHVVYFFTLMGHIALMVSGVISLLPTSILPPPVSRGAYRQTLMMAIMLQSFLVSRKYGLPKLKKAYWLDVLKDNETHYILAALLCMMSRPFFLGVAGHLMRSALFVSTGMQDMLRRGPKILNQRIITQNLRKLTNMRYKIYNMMASLEILTGFMLIIEMCTPGRNIFLLFAWWQYLRARYVISKHSKSAFIQIRRKLDGWLIESSYVPSIVGTIYTKIKSLCARQASPEAARTRCSVM